MLLPHRLHPAASLRYDFIGLSNDTRAAYDRNEICADVVPTVFYRQEDGWLVELVDAYLRFERAIPAGHAVLTVGGKSYTALPSETALGRKDWSSMSPNGKEPQRRI